MAIHNTFYGYGQVFAEPRIIKDEDGNYSLGRCSFITIRGRRSTGNTLDHVRYDCPTIQTRKEIDVKTLDSLKVNDMMEIKGTLTSREVVRTTICPHCGRENALKGIVTYINPIYVGKRENNISREDGLALLQDKCEISNNCSVMGMVCQEPQFYQTEDGYTEAHYQLAIVRKFKILSDGPDRKTDFIWVRSYGKIAKTDVRAIKKGAVVFIDGVIQTKNYDRDVECEHCSEMYKTQEVSMDIVPYAVEYIKGHNPIIEDGEEIESQVETDIANILGA